MKKAPLEQANLYGAGLLWMGDAIYSREGRKFTTTTCRIHGLLFGKFKIGSKLRIEVIKNQDFVGTSNMVKALLVGWETYWKKKVMSQRREMLYLASEVMDLSEGDCLSTL